MIHRRKKQRTKPPPDRVDSRGHLSWLRRSCLCVVHNADCEGPTEAHHVRTRGAGGGDDEAIPLCAGHHRLRGDSIHRLGRDSFENQFGLNLPALAREHWMADRYHRFKWETDVLRLTQPAT